MRPASSGYPGGGYARIREAGCFAAVPDPGNPDSRAGKSADAARRKPADLESDR